MALERLNGLVTKEGFYFQAWDDPYSKGIWAALGLFESQIDCVRDLSSAGDLDMIPAMDYVFSADWLPYVTGQTLIEAMQKLEDRLAALPAVELSRNSRWASLVSEAIQALADATHGRSYYGDKQPAPLADLPATFGAALAAAQDETAK